VDLLYSIKRSIFYQFDKYSKNRYNLEVNLSDMDEAFNVNVLEYKTITNKAARKHLEFIILPAVSVYEYLIIKKINEAKALKYLEEYVMNYYSRYAKVYRIFGKLPFFYNIFRWILPSYMKSYPTPFWKIEWYKNNKLEIAFNITDCLYYKTFMKYSCVNLTPIFCRVDNLCYDNNFLRCRRAASCKVSVN
jgi:hypothetical protein